MRMTGADAVIAGFAAAGMPALFGVPGGGSSLELLAAAKKAGIPFVLARTENGAGIMASALAELTHRPVGLLTTRGPGVSNAANGMANASLERAPVLLVADGFGAKEAAFATHQLFDQAAMMAPVTRAQRRTAKLPPGRAVVEALEAALGAPRGPAYLELSASLARDETAAPPAFRAPALPPIGHADVAHALRLIAAARRPVIIAGLEAPEPARCAALRRLLEALGCPALVTYKAKGVIPDAHPLFGGVFTGGAAEVALMQDADLILLAGADPVEFISQPWRFTAPVIEMASCVPALRYVAPEVALTGEWARAAMALADGAPARGWPEGHVAERRDAWAASLRNTAHGNRGMAPSHIVTEAQATLRALGEDPRIAVDAGAHMFPCTTFWQCERPGDLLISNGLATMGYALPAAIAAAWHDPARGALAMTGDGGLLMCAGELATAAALRLNLTILVFNDAALSLIDIKKGARDLPEGALDWPEADFAQVMRGFGGSAWRVADAQGLRAALREAQSTPGPRLIDVRTDPSSYPAQIKALRG